MGTIQTAFNVNHAAAVAGAMFGSLASVVRESRLAAAAIPFGTIVCQRAAPADGTDQCANPAATADVTARLRGIALYNDTARNGFGYEINQGVTYLRKGLCWMVCESAIAQDVDPFVRFAAGTGVILGALYNAADTATAVQTGLRLRTRSVLAAAGLVLVEIDLP
jgi:hypothetical protein